MIYDNNYDPHSDLDFLDRNITFAQRTMGYKDTLDRIRNWIDETQIEMRWNAGQPAKQETAPIGAKHVHKPIFATIPPKREEELRTADDIRGLRQLNKDYQERHARDINRVNQVRSMFDVQKHPGNRNASENMYGMYMGLELAMSCLDDRDFRPLEYGGDKTTTPLERQMNDVRNKNTALEEHNRDMRAMFEEAIADWKRKNETLHRSNIALRSSNASLNMRCETQSKSIEQLSAQCQNYKEFGESAHKGRQEAIDEAYQLGLREGKTEARQEHAYRTPEKPNSWLTD